MSTSTFNLPFIRKVGEIEIINYKPEMRNEILKLWKKNFNNKKEVFIKDVNIAEKNDPEMFIVAQQYNEVIGTCLGAFDGFRYWMYYLCVAKHLRRKKIASRLLRQMEDTLMKRGADEVGLHIMNHNHIAAKFYKSQGYFFEGSVCLAKHLED